MSGQSTRRCSRCTRELLLRNFRICFRRSSSGGRVGYPDSWCRDCRRDYQATVRGRDRGVEPAKERGEAFVAMSQADVAKACGWTRGYVSQLELSAFRKIRRRLAILFRRDLLRFPDSDLAAVLFRS